NGLTEVDMKDSRLVTLNSITQAYGKDENKFYAVENVNLEINPGEFVALLGPSGCGKSTLLRIITGLQQPSRGVVLYKNKELQGVNPFSTIVFQTFALFPWLTVLQNVELALQTKDVPNSIRVSRAIDAIDRVGLDGFETAYPRELSGGMRQKVGFARAIVNEPELLCLDEPFSALDVLSAESLRGELLELWTEGKIPTKAILMVTHNIEEAIYMASRVVVMDKNPGRIIADLPITLSYPRDRKSVEFQTIVDKVYSLLAGQTLPDHLELGSAPGEPGYTRKLPNVAIANLNGLLEFIYESDKDKIDIYMLADELGLDSDSLLYVTEFAEILGFVKIDSGDISITPLGETYTEASITARKEIFASRVKRVPLLKWLLNLLNASANKQLDRNVVQTALELEFPAAVAEEQIDIIMTWGRYAELIVYDDNEELIYLEPGT
ncbi:MAG TPA: nitrate/sulfonate/bicarbonate ABC transporter ATP-binding protein, partial [Melioribacteraceae bacterium]|nr:nitrate/sulfonate/bicarbonate ABC transporter ATP-binding protein [Melioribacteraceae bacterium]